jgi:hypothetical protein
MLRFYDGIAFRITSIVNNLVRSWMDWKMILIDVIIAYIFAYGLGVWFGWSCGVGSFFIRYQY